MPAASSARRCATHVQLGALHWSFHRVHAGSQAPVMAARCQVLRAIELSSPSAGCQASVEHCAAASCVSHAHTRETDATESHHVHLTLRELTLLMCEVQIWLRRMQATACWAWSVHLMRRPPVFCQVQSAHIGCECAALESDCYLARSAAAQPGAG
jgi:hypothetical protein